MNRRKVLLKGRSAVGKAFKFHPFDNTSINLNDTPLGKFFHIKEQNQTDKVLRRKYTLICINSMMGVILMIASLQIAWNGGSLVVKHANLAIRISNSILTFIIIVQLLDYYRTRLNAAVKDWRSYTSYGFGSISPWIVLRHTALAPEELLEIFIVFLHPLPFLHNVPFWGDEKWGVLMFLRLYMLIHVIRDYSTIYQSRKKLERMYKYTPPKFNWFLSVKTYHYQNPILTMSTLTVSAMLIFGYIIYVFEREVPGTNIDLGVGFYLSFAAMVAGWPADPFGEYNPATFVGKCVTTISLLVGLLLLAALLELVMSKLGATSHDRPAIMWVAHYNLKKKQKDAAARLIQLVYRRHKEEQKHLTISTQYYFRRYINLTKKLQWLRRELTLYEVQIEEIESQAPHIFEMKQTE